MQKIVGAAKVTASVRINTNTVVMMGMGEPLLNLTNVVPAMEIMLDDWFRPSPKRRASRLNVRRGARLRDKLGDMIDVALAISLHAE